MAQPVHATFSGQRSATLPNAGKVLHYEADHFDFYHDTLDQVVSDEIDFLRRHLMR